ncbi:MAG: hypothetical protein BGO78_17950 [Chloroflexi bacterium 44-23]|nr:MAG: hypothetical protein BGO78_17950 [Chloroflexi bacterium 44-23]
MTTHAEDRNGILRALNAGSDLNQVADLIELCFRGAMDDDGYDYINYLRRMAKDVASSYWGLGNLQPKFTPMQGFVYIVGGKLVGNLSIIPFRKSGQVIYLIANVAVHPDYRRAGIARKLTSKALEYIQSRSNLGAWLQVRDDNQAAQALYLSMGFKERIRRSTWTFKPRNSKVSVSEQKMLIRPTKMSDWQYEIDLLNSIYPDLLRWNLGFSIDRFNPSLRAAINRFIKGQIVKNYAVEKGGNNKGFFVFEKSSLFSDILWIAPKDNDEETIPQILNHLVNNLKTRKPFSFNYPAYRSEDLLTYLGFSKNHTLIWMEEIEPKNMAD